MIRLKRVLFILSFIICWGNIGCIGTEIELYKAEAALLSDPYREIVKTGKWYIRYSIDERLEAEENYKRIEADPMLKRDMEMQSITKRDQERSLKYLDGRTRETIFAVDGEKMYKQNRDMHKDKISQIGSITICKNGKIYGYGMHFMNFMIGNEFVGRNKKEGFVIREEDISKQKRMILNKPIFPQLVDVLLFKNAENTNTYSFFYKLIGTGKEELRGVEYEYEEYEKKFSYAKGEELSLEEKMRIYFKNGKIEKFKNFQDGSYYIDIVEFKSNVDEKIFEIPKGFKFYAVPKNDMDGLLNKKVLVEKY